MKVFLVGDFSKNNRVYSGVQGVLVNIANGLIKHPEIELVLISLSLDADLEKFEGKCNTYKLNFRRSLIQARWKFNSIVRREQPTIIHLQDVVPGILLYRSEYREIFVVTQHAILREERLWQVSLKRRISFIIKEFVEKYYIKRIQNIIFISEYNKNIYLKNAVQNKTLHFALIPNPVNKTFFQKSDFEVAQMENEIYFVGEIKKRKGLHVLISALHLLKQHGVGCKLHVIGGFKEIQYEKEIFRLIGELRLSENVHFCGWKSQFEILEYSRNIPVFVLPSFHETLPLSIAEAMCQGKIVVATNICGIPEMIEDGVSGYLFSPGNFMELAKILEKVFANIGQQRDVSVKARLTSEKFNPKNVAHKTIDFYRKLNNVTF